MNDVLFVVEIGEDPVIGRRPADTHLMNMKPLGKGYNFTIKFIIV